MWNNNRERAVTHTQPQHPAPGHPAPVAETPEQPLLPQACTSSAGHACTAAVTPPMGGASMAMLAAVTNTNRQQHTHHNLPLWQRQCAI